uniref:Uncharacterized protein n=1 Tax=Glossina palpalis gambiensis TaxID=67801 RepID=A0A1B0BV88_9MUSC
MFIRYSSSITIAPRVKSYLDSMVTKFKILSFPHWLMSERCPISTTAAQNRLIRVPLNCDFIFRISNSILSSAVLCTKMMAGQHKEAEYFRNCYLRDCMMMAV